MSFKRRAQSVIGSVLSIGAKGLPHGPHCTRYTMYRELSTILPEWSEAGKKVLSISHSSPLINALGLEEAEISEANYPQHNAVDLKAFGNNEFDYVVSDQVLEHVEGNPQCVFDASRRVLKPGGVAVHTTCFINPVHGWPSDYWRFTPQGLAYLARDFSEIIKVGGFGNPWIWVVSALGMRSTPVPHSKWHPLNYIATKNDTNWPVSVWIVARK